MSFDLFVRKFKQTQIGNSLLRTVEDSPYHREENTWVHTMMTIDQFERNFNNGFTDRQQLMIKITLLFHDTGKPFAEVTKQREDGSNYRSYGGHESISANEFALQIVSNSVLQEMIPDQNDWRKIRFMIEHHLPYGLKNQKLKDLKLAIQTTLGEDVECFYAILKSDCWGRISDDHTVKKQSVLTWIDEFKSIEVQPKKLPSGNGSIYILTGPSGSGKSTFIKGLDGCVSFSFDKHRYVYYKKKHNLSVMEENDINYDIVWKYASENEGDFKQDFFNYVRQQIKENNLTKIVAADNTNLTKKARGPWCEIAKQLNFEVIIVEFWRSYEFLQQAFNNRTDRIVPHSSLRNQINNYKIGWLGVESNNIRMIT